MVNYEFGAGIWMFQQFVDRYATDAYGPPVSTLEAIERAAAVGDIKVLDINYPFAGEGVTVAQVRETLQRTGLRAQAITPHLYMREFQLGSFSNPDPAVRSKATISRFNERSSALAICCSAAWRSAGSRSVMRISLASEGWDVGSLGIRS